MQNDPGLRLAAVGRVEAGGLGVIGMDLNREILLRIEELEQQRELGLRIVAPQQVGTELPHERMERQAAQRTGRHATLVVTMVDDFPAFGEMLAGGQRFTQDVRQASPAPQVMAIQGLKA